VRLARPLPYPPEQVRAVTLLADGGRLWLAVTAAVPVQQHDLDPGEGGRGRPWHHSSVCGGD
jgi:putative transposase